MRKVAWHMIPFLSIGYMINALDRFNVSMAALTMNKALGLSATAYGLGAGAFFWSYVLFQFPANLLLSRIGARVWISLIMAFWGICSAGTAFVTGETSFVAARFLLGVAEAGFFPGVAYFMTCWFPALYRGRMMGIFYAFGAASGIVGGPLGGNLLKLDGTFGLAGWQWIFLVEALPAVLLACYGFATLCNRPAEAAWLTEEERNWLQTHLDAEASAKPGHGHGILRSIGNPQMIVLTIAYMLMAYGVYAMAFFLPLIVKTLGLSNLTIGYVLILPNLCGTIGMLLVSRSSDRSGERVWHVVAPVALAGIGAMAAGLVLGNVYLTIAAFCLATFGIAASLPVFWNLPTAYLGAGAAAGGIALINSVGNISGYVAPQVTGLLRDTSGGYMVPMVVTGGVMLTAAALVLVSGIQRYVRRSQVLASQVTLLH
ncbi:MFS transporter [Rhodopila sp.]|jgi:MFS family permease|uniref:MFS transporter n=1 Tax=Rhodopila sp. TaxID=2480087 RepID=UPI002C84DF9A|nr:MFS transporter [Rhodopila sp.]HVZ06478.1 MFS transporter [Rhodopila sp.]